MGVLIGGRVRAPDPGRVEQQHPSCGDRLSTAPPSAWRCKGFVASARTTDCSMNGKPIFMNDMNETWYPACSCKHTVTPMYVFTFGRPGEGVRTFSAIPAMTTLSLAPMRVPMPPRHDPKASDQMSGSM